MLLIRRRPARWFFLGELYTDLPLPVDAPASDHCGTCTPASTSARPGASSRPYQLDARRCISYLTIELHGSDSRRTAPADRQPHIRLRRLPAGLPLEPLRAAHREDGFRRRATGSTAPNWSNCSPGAKTTSSPAPRAAPIRRIGYERWLRNLAVALGNAPGAGPSRRRSTRGAPTPPTWCASTCAGRSTGSAASSPLRYPAIEPMGAYSSSSRRGGSRLRKVRR